MDIATADSPNEGKAGPLAGFSRLARAVSKAAKSASPSSVAARIKLEGESQAVAAIVIRALARNEPSVVKSMLDDAWSVYGEYAFGKAMSARCWSLATNGGQELIHDILLITPAEALCGLSNSDWLIKLANLVPWSHWGDRTLEDSAYQWSLPEEVAKRGIKLASVGPLARICANTACADWQGCFEIIGSRVSPESKAEVLACLSMLGGHSRQVFEAWAESRAIQAHVGKPDPALTHGRSKPRL